MKTKCLVVSTDNSLVKKMRSEGASFDVVHIDSALAAINYTNVCTNTRLIIYQAHPDTTSALKYIRFFKENLRKELLFFIVARTEAQIEELFIEGVNDVFPADVEVQDIYLRAQLLIVDSNDSYTEIAAERDFTVPRWKRSFDIAFSLTAIIALAPLLLLIAAAIRIESKGKVFYSAKRVGTGYRIFNFYKFRSMYTGADRRVDSLLGKNQYAVIDAERSTAPRTEVNRNNASLLYSDEEAVHEAEYLARKKSQQENSFFKMANDPRITKIGRIIRNTSMDELPQLLNILKGDMSVVGNRPLPLYEAEMLTSDKWAKRFLAPAGLTGLWQVTKRGNANAMSADERKQLDIDYVDNFNFSGDMSIILRTIPALLQHENV